MLAYGRHYEGHHVDHAHQPEDEDECVRTMLAGGRVAEHVVAIKDEPLLDAYSVGRMADLTGVALWACLDPPPQAIDVDASHATGAGAGLDQRVGGLPGLGTDSALRLSNVASLL